MINNAERSFGTQSASLGTPRYISPEQARATKKIDGRMVSIRWARRCITCCRGIPFDGRDGRGIMMKHLNAQLPNHRNRPEHSEALCRLFSA